MASWILGDIHGCARELDQLLARIGPGSSDAIVACGDLFHRGPDPAGVMRILQRVGARFVLGNHELVPLARHGLAPTSIAKDERPPLRNSFGPLEAAALLGDGDEPCLCAPEERGELLAFLQTHSGFYLRHGEIAGAAACASGQPWCVVHAGLRPDLALTNNPISELVGRRRLSLPGHPWWYELYRGEELVIFGHTPSPLPRMHRVGDRLLALGLDTGCVYGGKLTAYCPERDDFKSVRAERAWARERRAPALR